MDENKLVKDNGGAPDAPQDVQTERELIVSLQRRIDAMERREAELKARRLVLHGVLTVVLLVAILLAAPRVRAAVKTLDQVSSTVQKYSLQLKELDPQKLQGAIKVINGLDTDALDKAGEELDGIDLDTIMTQFGRLESVGGDLSELKSAIYIIGTAIARIVAGYQ